MAAGGLGLASVLVGVYNSLQSPVIVDTRESVVRSDPSVELCALQTSSVEVVIASGEVALARATKDDRGIATWKVTDEVLVNWPSLPEVYVQGESIGTVNLSKWKYGAGVREFNRTSEGFLREMQAWEQAHPQMPPRPSESAIPPESPTATRSQTLGPDVTMTWRDWFHRLRVTASYEMRRHPNACREVVPLAAQVGTAALLTEEKEVAMLPVFSPSWSVGKYRKSVLRSFLCSRSGPAWLKSSLTW